MRPSRVLAALALVLSSACSGASLQTGTLERNSSRSQTRPAQTERQPAAGKHEQPGSSWSRVRDVPFSFERAGQQFTGVVSVPEHRTGVRLPGVVLVHGSGPMSRDGIMPGQLGLGFGFDFPVYAELARELSALGYVVARYDKRTCLATRVCRGDDLSGLGVLSAFADEDTVVDDFVEDAKAAYFKLASLDFVDADRIAFVGHSQGAQLVPRLLTDVPTVPAGVMLTPPYGDVPELLREQGKLLTRIMHQAGKDDRISEGVELIRAAGWLEALKRGRRTPARILGQPLPLWRSWIRASLEAPVLARSLTRPLLVVGGGYDYNVSPAQLEHWQTWLSGSRHRVVLVPCVTHALNCISQANPMLIEPRDIGHHVDAVLLQNLAGFLHETLSSTGTDN